MAKGRSPIEWIRDSWSALPVKALTMGLVATLVFLMLLTWSTSNAYRAFEEVSTQGLRLQSLIGTIYHLDEVLTMSARMAAVTGETRWEERYRRFEPQLASAIREAVDLTADTFAPLAEASERANEQLVAMEEKAFELVRAGRDGDAAEILFSEQYEELKRTYAEGMTLLTAALDERIHRSRDRHRQGVLRAWAFAIAIAVLLMLVWVGVVGRIRQHLEERALAEEERRRLEAQMQEAQKLEGLGVLAGGIAHDFNNLLTVILGNSRMALAEFPPGSPPHGQLERVCSAAEYAADLVQQMLTYSGNSSATLRPVDLSRLVEGMLALLRSVATERCDLETACPSDLPAVKADPTQVRQVILNLITNASAALGDKGGTVWVRTGAEERTAEQLAGTVGASLAPGEYVYLEVADTGVGMDAATQRRIFEPFFTGKSFGRGLGLATVLGIMREHHGGLEVESQPGRGSRIRALFPRAGGSVAAEAEAGVPEAPDQRVGRVLLVDDEEGVLELGARFLERAGFTVCTAHGGPEAVRVFAERAGDFDAVVLDLAMPELSGGEVFAKLRSVNADVSVVATSGYSESLAEERYGTHDFAAFVQKPYEPDELIEAVRQAIRRHDGEDP